jgi:matrixin
MPSRSSRRLTIAVTLVTAAQLAAVPVSTSSSATPEGMGPSRRAVLNGKFVARQVFKPPCPWVHVMVRRQTPDPRFVGEALSRPCRVVIRRGDYTFLRICALIVHEYGHLAGLSHSTDPNDIMFPGRPARYPPCVRHQRLMIRRAARARRRTL